MTGQLRTVTPYVVNVYVQQGSRTSHARCYAVMEMGIPEDSSSYRALIRKWRHQDGGSTIQCAERVRLCKRSLLHGNTIQRMEFYKFELSEAKITRKYPHHREGEWSVAKHEHRPRLDASVGYGGQLLPVVRAT